MKDNKYKILWIAIIILFLINIGLLLWFNFFSNKNLGFGANNKLFLVKELQFDNKQTKIYTKLRDEHAQQMRHLREEVRSMKEDFYSKMADTISDEMLKQKAIAIESRMVEADVLTFKHFQEVRSICTPRQQEKFDKIVLGLIRSIERPAPPPEGQNRLPSPEEMGPPPPPR